MAGRRTRRVAPLLLALATGGMLAGAWLVAGRWEGHDPPELPLFTWSPLGLYGVQFAATAGTDRLAILVPVLALATAGAWLRGRRSRGATGAGGAGDEPPGVALGDASALVALAGALWVPVAADLVSLYLGVAVYLAGTAGVLWAVAGTPQAGRRLILVGAAATGLLATVLVLGKINGHFRLAQLSTTGFSSAAFLGVLLAAAVCAPAPPFHGWLLRCARHPLAPALAAAGGAIALTLLLAAFRTTAGQFPPAWQRTLAALGWLAVLVGVAVGLIRRALPVRLAALLAGRAGLTFLAAGVATPASMAAMVLHGLVVTPALAALWVAAIGAPPRGPLRAVVRGSALARDPAFWLGVLLLATAAGLPGTIAGLARNALVMAITAWPAGSQLLRLPAFLLDAATLAVGGALLWRLPRWRALPLRWAAVPAIALAVTLAVPAALPERLLGRWFGPAAAAAAGTTLPPLALDAARLPHPLSVVLGAAAAWALVRRLMGREWLPATATAALGMLAYGWSEGRRWWRRHRLGSAPTLAVALLWRRLEQAAGRGLDLAGPVEERYYAAAAVMLAVALIYIIAR